MKRSMRTKLHSTRGITRLAAILCAAVLALLAVAAVPVVRAYKARADAYACALARDAAQRELSADYGADRTGSAVLDGVCPAGGEVRVVWTDDTPAVVCSLHGG